MDHLLPRTLGRFAAFFTVALPLFAILTTAALHRPFVNLVGDRGATKHWLTDLYFNHFELALALPVGVTALTGTLAVLTLRRRETPPVATLARLFALLAVSAMVAPAWIAGFLFAAVLG